MTQPKPVPRQLDYITYCEVKGTSLALFYEPLHFSESCLDC